MCNGKHLKNKFKSYGTKINIDLHSQKNTQEDYDTEEDSE